MRYQVFAILLVIGCAAPAAAQTSEAGLLMQESADKLAADDPVYSSGR